MEQLGKMTPFQLMGGVILNILCASLMICSPSAQASSLAGSPATRATTSTLSDEMIEKFGLHGTKPDKFVQASPMIVAAVCSDGVVMVASHTVSVEEKLLRQVFPEEKGNEENNEIKPTENEDGDNNNNVATRWKDLQEDYGGPFRINKIDRFGTHLMCAGWRADGEMLTEKCRSIASREIAKFGPPKWGLPYGRYLAMEASLWMAQRAVSDGIRALSCVGLLASCTDEDSVNGLSLWLIEATGAYRVRALAIGGGETDGVDDGKQIVADIVNQQLQKIDFSEMTARDGAKCILKILNGSRATEGFIDTYRMIEEGTSKSGPAIVPEGCEMEIAITNSEQRQMQRIRLSSLFGTKGRT